MELHPKHLEWLSARGITEAVATSFGLHTHNDGRSTWLRVPYVEEGQTINHKWRKTQAKHHRMDQDAPLLLWNWPALKLAAETGKDLIIHEGEWDALTSIHCGMELSVSVPNGAPQDATEDPFDAKRYEWFHRHRSLLDRVKKFILAVDNDNAGRTLAADLARLLGPERCKFVTYHDGCKDMNEEYLTHGSAGVVSVLATAKDYPVKGLYRLSEFPELPEFNPISVDVDGLEKLFPLVAGTFSVISGWAGHGKSSLLMVMLANLMKKGIPIGLGSFETLPKPVMLQRFRAILYRCEDNDPRVFRDGPADALLEEKLSIISNMHVTDDNELTIEAIIELAIVAVIRDGIRLLVLDPWNEIEHKRGRDETETDYVGRAIRLLKRFGRDYGCAVWVVAHPRKPQSDGNPKAPSLYDLAGSANFANKADYGLICHRDDLASPIMDVKVVKKRMGLPGSIGWVRLAFNSLNNGYDQERF